MAPESRASAPVVRVHLGLLLVPGLILLGCSGAPLDLVATTPGPEYRAPAPALPAAWLRIATDKRPPEEHGARKYPGKSYVGGNALVEPTHVSLLRLLARDLVQAGVFGEAGLEDRGQPYVLEITISHLGASYTEGLETLIPVLPTSSVEARCALDIKLRDDVGRVFLERSFEARESTVAAMLTGAESTAIRALRRTLQAVSDEVVRAVRPAVDAFWENQRPTSGRPGLSPLRGSRSSSAR